MSNYIKLYQIISNYIEFYYLYYIKNPLFFVLYFAAYRSPTEFSTHDSLKSRILIKTGIF